MRSTSWSGWFALPDGQALGLVGTAPATHKARSRGLAGSITERYIHAAQVLFPGPAARAEASVFGAREEEEPPQS